MTNLPTKIGQVFIQSCVVAIENVQERDVPPHEGQTALAVWWETPEWERTTKPAYMWVHACHPYTIGFPGVSAELYFSSKEKFLELLERPMDEYEALVKVWVPKDFDHWDFIPNDY